MRRFIVVAASMLLLTTGLAIAEEPVRMVPLAEAVPLPRLPEVAVSRLHVVAIGAGAVFGVIAVNIVSGGMITPFLAGVSLAMPADATAVAAAPIAAAATPAVAAAPAAAASIAAPVVAATTATMMAAQVGLVAIGGVIGATVGNWLYGSYGSH